MADPLQRMWGVNAKMKKLWDSAFPELFSYDLVALSNAVVEIMNARCHSGLRLRNCQRAREGGMVTCMYDMDDVPARTEKEIWKEGVHGTDLETAFKILGHGFSEDCCESEPSGIYFFNVHDAKRQHKAWNYAPCCDLPIMRHEVPTCIRLGAPHFFARGSETDEITSVYSARGMHLSPREMVSGFGSSPQATVSKIVAHVFVRVRLHAHVRAPETLKRRDSQWLTHEAVPFAIDIEVISPKAVECGTDWVDAFPTVGNLFPNVSHWLRLDTNLKSSQQKITPLVRSIFSRPTNRPTSRYREADRRRCKFPCITQPPTSYQPTSRPADIPRISRSADQPIFLASAASVTLAHLRSDYKNLCDIQFALQRDIVKFQVSLDRFCDRQEQ